MVIHVLHEFTKTSVTADISDHCGCKEYVRWCSHVMPDDFAFCISGSSQGSDGTGFRFNRAESHKCEDECKQCYHDIEHHDRAVCIAIHIFPCKCDRFIVLPHQKIGQIISLWSELFGQCVHQVCAYVIRSPVIKTSVRETISKAVGKLAFGEFLEIICRDKPHGKCRCAEHRIRVFLEQTAIIRDSNCSADC